MDCPPTLWLCPVDSLHGPCKAAWTEAAQAPAEQLEAVHAWPAARRGPCPGWPGSRPVCTHTPEHTRGHGALAASSAASSGRRCWTSTELQGGRGRWAPCGMAQAQPAPPAPTPSATLTRHHCLIPCDMLFPYRLLVSPHTARPRQTSPSKACPRDAGILWLRGPYSSVAPAQWAPPPGHGPGLRISARLGLLTQVGHSPAFPAGRTYPRAPLVCRQPGPWASGPGVTPRGQGSASVRWRAQERVRPGKPSAVLALTPVGTQTPDGMYHRRPRDQ